MTLSIERSPVRLGPDETQEQLRTALRTFLSRRSDESAVRRLMETETGHDAALWKQLAEELGLIGIDVPEELGGSGGSFRELAVVLEELGRASACLPYFSTVVLAAGALLLGDDAAAREEHLPRIAAGTCLATLAVTEDDGSWDVARTATSARRDTDGSWRLDGTKSFVLDGLLADLLLVVARSDEGLSLFAVEGHAPGLQRTSMRTLDPTRKLAKLVLRDVPARLVGRDGAAEPLVQRVLDRAVVALAAEQLGGAQRTLEMAVDYAKIRLQFGRPIGSFQAVKHRCADMAMKVDAGRSAVAWAVAAAADGSAELPVAAAMAGVVCSEAFVFTSAENVQVHGGIGFTWEHPAHLYFRRARSSSLLFGDPAHHRAQLLERLGV
ncbi:MAG: acyl-CoA dehydrogenase domain protein [Frankiales bacterium]|nr:acyl-CoA dehydrogenase domain protein [Frankiales bacterium]